TGALLPLQPTTTVFRSAEVRLDHPTTQKPREIPGVFISACFRNPLLYPAELRGQTLQELRLIPPTLHRHFLLSARSYTRHQQPKRPGRLHRRGREHSNPVEEPVATSADHSTPAPARDNPAKPSHEFPLFPHSAGVWARQI